MRVSALLPIICLTSVLAAPATIAAGQEVPLALKFAQGDVTQYDVSFSGSGGLRGPDGQLLPMGVRGSLSMSQTVQEVLPSRWRHRGSRWGACPAREIRCSRTSR